MNVVSKEEEIENIIKEASSVRNSSPDKSIELSRQAEKLAGSLKD